MVETDVLQVVEQPPLRRPEFERGESEQRHQRLDPEAGLSLLDEERLPQSHREPSHRGPGRGPLGLAGLRSRSFRRSGPEDRRPDGIPVLACRPRPGGQPLESNLHAGLPSSAHVDLSRHGRRLEPVFDVDVDRRRRFRRAGRPRPGEKSQGVEVLGQHALDGSRGLDRGEHERPRRRLEEGQVQEHGREDAVGRRVGDRGQQMAVLP